MCGKDSGGTTPPDDWVPEIVWSLKLDEDEVEHVAHDQRWSRVDGHLCDECYEEADSFAQNFDGSYDVDGCSWCGTDEVFAELGSAQGGYDLNRYGVCEDCSPFEITV